MLALTPTTLDRFDAQGTLLSSQKIGPLSSPLSSPRCATVSPDGATLWFHQAAGNPYGPAIWSMDLKTLETRRRLYDELSFGLYCPTPSPDGNYLALIQGQAYTDGVTGSVTAYLGAAPMRSAETDTTREPKYLADKNRKSISTMGEQMAFY